MSVSLFVDDAGFVRGPATLVYRRLTDVAGWPDWWRGTQVRPPPPARIDEREPWGLSLEAGPFHTLRLNATFHGWRHDTGVVVAVSGDVDGEAEFWLEPTSGGTVVHHLLVATTQLRPARRVHEGYRRAIRRGLWGLKDVVQLESRTMVGLRP